MLPLSWETQLLDTGHFNWCSSCIGQCVQVALWLIWQHWHLSFDRSSGSAPQATVVLLLALAKLSQMQVWKRRWGKSRKLCGLISRGCWSFPATALALHVVLATSVCCGNCRNQCHVVLVLPSLLKKIRARSRNHILRISRKDNDVYIIAISVVWKLRITRTARGIFFSGDRQLLETIHFGMPESASWALWCNPSCTSRFFGDACSTWFAALAFCCRMSPVNIWLRPFSAPVTCIFEMPWSVVTCMVSWLHFNVS